MESTQMPARVATWLELAIAPEWRRQHCSVRVHALGNRSKGGCYALSMNDRWLCTGDGSLTVFKGIDAALRFLKVVRVEDFEPGETPDVDVIGNGRQYCLCVGRGGELTPCPGSCRPRQLDS